MKIERVLISSLILGFLCGLLSWLTFPILTGGILVGSLVMTADAWLLFFLVRRYITASAKTGRMLLLLLIKLLVVGLILVASVAVAGIHPLGLLVGVSLFFGSVLLELARGRRFSAALMPDGSQSVEGS